MKGFLDVPRARPVVEQFVRWDLQFGRDFVDGFRFGKDPAVFDFRDEAGSVADFF